MPSPGRTAASSPGGASPVVRYPLSVATAGPPTVVISVVRRRTGTSAHTVVPSSPVLVPQRLDSFSTILRPRPPVAAWVGSPSSGTVCPPPSLTETWTLSGVDPPGDADLGSGQRHRMPQGVAEQFADHERDVTDGGIVDTGRDQVRHQAPTGHADA